MICTICEQVTQMICTICVQVTQDKRAISLALVPLCIEKKALVTYIYI